MKPLLLCLLLALPVPAEPPAKTSTVVAGARVFRDAQVRRLDAFTARITHATGAATVPAWELSEAQQRNFGFDPAATAAEAARRAEASRVAESLRQREAARVAGLAADAARAQEQERLRVSAGRIATANAEREERDRAREFFNRARSALLNWSVDQSALREGVYDPDRANVTAADRLLLRDLFRQGGRLDDLLDRYQVPR